MCVLPCCFNCCVSVVACRFRCLYHCLRTPLPPTSGRWCASTKSTAKPSCAWAALSGSVGLFTCSLLHTVDESGLLLLVVAFCAACQHKHLHACGLFRFAGSTVVQTVHLQQRARWTATDRLFHSFRSKCWGRGITDDVAHVIFVCDSFTGWRQSHSHFIGNMLTVQ